MLLLLIYGFLSLERRYPSLERGFLTLELALLTYKYTSSLRESARLTLEVPPR